MRRRKTVAAIAVSVSAALVLGACSGGGDNGGGGGAGLDDSSQTGAKGDNGDGTYNAPEVEPGGPVSITHDAPFTTYNNSAASGNNFNNTLVLTSVLTTPFKIDDQLQIMLNADVMESAEVIQEDPQIVEYVIREGVTWSDGEAWDCDDFYLSWLSRSATILDDAGDPLFVPASTSGAEDATFTCEDDLTGQLEFEEAYADWRGEFEAVSMLPAHILEQESGIEDITSINNDSSLDDKMAVAEFWNNGWNGWTEELSPGSGPYMIESFTPNSAITLVRNPEWIGNPAGPESVSFQAIADASAQQSALQDQQVQVIQPQADNNVAEQLRALADQGIRYEAAEGLTFEHLDINLDRPLFQDEAVRQAFAACIDRDDLVDKLVRGVNPEAQPLGSLFFTSEESAYADHYDDVILGDAEAAMSILEEAGWTQGSDGVYEQDGERLSFSISHTSIPRRNETVALIQSHCADAGIEITDDNDDQFLDSRVSEGDYDVALFAWVGTPFKSSKVSIYSDGGGQNWSGWETPEATELLRSVNTELDDDVRDQALVEADEIYSDLVYSLPLFSVPNSWAYNESVDKVTYQGSDGVAWNVWEWEVSP
ncbi:MULTISPECIES: ABC transporter family substrate-binding protein [Actinoalloteichus]|uniref:ABC-type dipeptide transport system, periplasmic component n=1 Tax=Actinoalloteichus fjordicus TaxID=1612552 RepID=A0AAC9PQE8_9PSEU|nr:MULTISPECIES: ABC transporter family substrate-binding protein [Actinoalloteichus]APU12953.1 ABC-type dipeptide transport system, periplasmic component [Actinoalloteichus fjordicus]APU18924.1 ABC-type dipeptide transport system, periplasmic component [Actinoalloteichus sp. GBA129-24]